jgi:acetyltransferase-like isoleucine patch superfamily enzyme
VEFGHHVLVREGVEIGRGSLIGTNVVIDGNCKIGSGVSIQTGAYICSNSIIGDFVFLGPYCVLTNDKYVAQREVELKGPIIESGASVGANAVIMAGVRIGEGAVIGAQALVTKDVPGRKIFFGVPAREVRDVPGDWRPLLRERGATKRR